jgi:putative PEP-CTERM system TPR-repeat lipoprotein
MKKSRILPLVGVAVLVAGGGAYGYIRYQHDPLRDGRALLAKGDLRGALIDLRAAVRDQQGNKNAHFALALANMRGNDPAAAERELRAALDLGYDPAEIQPLLAQTYLDQQKFIQILADFPVPVGPPASVAPILVARGLAMLALNDPAGALAATTQAEKLLPDSPDAAFATAQVALATKDLKLAEQKADRTLELNPHQGRAHLMKAQLLNVRGDRAGATEQLTLALVDSPHLPSALAERANLLINSGDDAKAKADVDTLLADIPNDPIGIYLDMILHVRKKEFSAANVDLQKISTVLTRFPRALYFDALVKANLGQVEQAMDSATRYVAQNPHDPNGIKLLARIDLSNKRPDLAAAALGRAIPDVKPDGELLDLLGRSYALSGKSPDALKTYMQAAASAPANPDILSRLASTRLSMGDVGGATTDLQKALALDPQQPQVGAELVVAALASGDLGQVRFAIDKLRAMEGDSEAVGNFEGLLKIAELDLEGAKAAFTKTLAAFPNSIRTRINLIKVMGMQGKQADAEAAVADLITKYPTNDLVISVFVAAMLQQNKIPLAIEVVEKAHAAAPDDLFVTASLTDLLIRSGQAAKAVHMLDDTPKSQQSVPLLLTARARALAAAGNMKDAIDTLRKVLSVDERNSDVRTRMVDVMVESGDFDGARGALRDALRLSPGNLAVMTALARVDLKALGLDAALATADRLERDPTNLPGARVLKGDLYAGERRFDDAADAYAGEMKKNPSSVLAIRQAFALRFAGKSDQSLDLLHAWCAAHPDDVEALKATAANELALKHYKEAADHLRTVIAKTPNDAASLNNLAWLYQQLGEPGALALAQRAYLISSTAETADTYGWLLTTQGHADKGIIPLRFAVTQPPVNGTIVYHYAVALNDIGLRDDAIRNLTSVTKMASSFDGKDEARALLVTLSAAH